MAQFWRVKRHLNKLVGVYRIAVTVDDKEYFYVGQSVNIMERWVSHVADLVSNSHHCKRLQAAYDKAGILAITFKILELVDAERVPKKHLTKILLGAERKWIGTVPKNQLLNS